MEFEDIIRRPLGSLVGGAFKAFFGFFLLLLPFALGSEVGMRMQRHLLTPNLPHDVTGALALALVPSLAFFLVARAVGRRRADGAGSGNGAHGSAAWGSTRELVTPSGLVLGRQFRGRPGTRRRAGRRPGPLLRYDGPGHVLTVAPTRSGKGVGAVVPNLLGHPGALVVTDPKGENYAVTARHRRQAGHDVQALDPFDVVGGAAAYNPLDALDPAGLDAADDAAMIADMLVVPREGVSGDSAFWDTEAKALLSGLVLHVAAEERGPKRSLPHVRELLTLPPEAFTEFLKTMERSKKAHGLVARAAARLRQKSDKERSGVVSSAQNHTHFLDSPRMRRVLSRSTFDLSALKRPAGRLSVGGDGALADGDGAAGLLSLYVVIPPDRLDSYRGWVRLVVASSLLAVTRTPGQPRYRALFLLDEFANLGRMEPVLRAYSLLAGYGAQIWIFLQDLSQLRGTYRDKWGSFLANADVLQAFGTNDHETADLLSKMLGEATVLSANAGQNRGTNTPFGLPSFSRGRSEGHSETGRPLLTPDEVRRLPPDEQILFVRGAAPVLAHRLRYYEDAEYHGLHEPNPMRALALGRA